jgi:ABC-type sugar transport system ATPase subunit
MGRSISTGAGDSAVLLLSEPTRGVDIHSRHEIYQVIRGVANDGAAVVFTSTDLDEIFELADVIVTMFRGRVEGRYERENATTAQVLADMTHGATPHAREAS